MKKKEKEIKASGKENESPNKNLVNDLYFAVPDTNFTRSISNPEAVMRRRQQKLTFLLTRIFAPYPSQHDCTSALSTTTNLLKNVATLLLLLLFFLLLLLLFLLL